MSHKRRNNVFGACLITTALLLACSAQAKPDDFDITLIDTSHGKVKVKLKKKTNDQDVIGAVIRGSASVGVQGDPTMDAPMKAVPTSTPGEYIFKIEPGMDVFDLDLEADVPGESEKVTKKIKVKDPKSQ